MRRLAAGLLAVSVTLAAHGCELGPDSSGAGGVGSPLLIAHRGASAYAPEHTLAAYRAALEQGADYIEPDLQITRDGRLIAMHDVTLERTTDVREVFPDRFRTEEDGDSVALRWYVSDFTLSEIGQLDAGAWFSEEFRGARVPTLQEVIELARGRAGIYPETKAPDAYADVGFEMERLLVSELERHGLHRAGSDPETPVVVQSFSAESLRILQDDLESDLPRVLLIGERGADGWTSPEGLGRVSGFASGIGPAKGLLIDNPEIVERAHAAGLLVVPWTFGASEPGGFGPLREEMKHFVCELRVDGLFTNNPDLFPRGDSCE